MKKQSFFIFFAAVLYVAVGTLSYIKIGEIKLNPIKKEQRTLINYYEQDLYAQCRGLKYFDEMKTENPSLLIYDKFNKEYQLTLNYIEKDKNILGYRDFECP